MSPCFDYAMPLVPVTLDFQVVRAGMLPSLVATSWYWQWGCRAADRQGLQIFVARATAISCCAPIDRGFASNPNTLSRQTGGHRSGEARMFRIGRKRRLRTFLLFWG